MTHHFPTHLLFLLALLLLHTATPTTACTCLPQTLRQSYDNAVHVVVARVTSIRPLNPQCVPIPCNIVCIRAPCLCPPQPCRTLCNGATSCPGAQQVAPQTGSLIYTMRFKRVFKGCPPRTLTGDGRTFEAVSNVQSAACGVSFRVGQRVLMMLPTVVFTRRVGLSIFYPINICQGHRDVRGLSRMERRRLRRWSRLPENACLAQ